MARLSKEDYGKIYKKYNVDRVWSFSRIECYKQDKYEYYLKYIKKINGDRDDSAYAPYGTLAHDLIESYYNNEIPFENILSTYDNKSLELEMYGKKFDRTDETKNEKIKKDYDVCLRDYLSNIQKPKTDFQTELPVITDITDDIVLIGYIDLIEYENGKYTITDFKTSTIFSNADMKDKTAQLMLYAEAIRKRKGWDNFDNISIQYDFLKYVQVEYEQLNGSMKTRNIKRSEIGTSLSSAAKTFLKKSGYDDFDIDTYIQKMEYTNSIDCLPEEIKRKFRINKCIVKVDLSNEIIEEFKKDIIETVHNAINDENNYYSTMNENVFWSEIDQGKSFYFANLSEYSMDLHKPYKQYLVKNGLLMDTLQKQEQIKQEDNTPPWDIANDTTNKTIDDKWKDLFGD